VFTVRKALCPIDFSPSSDASLDAAIDLVRRYGAELYLLHVVEGPAPPESAVDLARVETSREAVRARLADLVASRDPEMEAHVLVSDGAPAEEILRIEELFGIDLIVIAPHGRPTLGKIIFGSVGDKVTRGSRAHLLLVKSPQDELPADPAGA
jgi:nucleotide-binding universal stress UspA family protein